MNSNLPGIIPPQTLDPKRATILTAFDEHKTSSQAETSGDYADGWGLGVSRCWTQCGSFDALGVPFGALD